MRLAGASVAESNNIVVGDDIFTTGQFENERLVERWNGSEVERVETLHRGKAGGVDAALDHAPFAIDEFEPLARGRCGDLFIFTHEGRQFELTQMMGEQNLRRRRAGSRSRRRHAALPETRTI